MLPSNDIHEYYTTKFSNPKLHKEYNHWKIMQGLSRAIKSMRTLGPKEIEGLGLVPEIREAYTFRRSESLKISDLSRDSAQNLNRAPSK